MLNAVRERAWSVYRLARLSDEAWEAVQAVGQFGHALCCRMGYPLVHLHKACWYLLASLWCQHITGHVCVSSKLYFSKRLHCQ
jgi:hypothetical protein